MSSGTTGIATVGAYTEHDIKIWGECFLRAVWTLEGAGFKALTQADL